MKVEYYNQYLHFKSIGLRAKATENLKQFIDSFESFEEKEQWTRDFLESGDSEDIIRHEIYKIVVFPVLLKGYQKQDFWSLTWLIKTIQNIYKVKTLHEQIDFKTDYQLLQDCYSIEPQNPEIRQALLKKLLSWLDYSIHEYPRGILYGHNGATIDECQDILTHIEFVKTLDPEEKFKDFLDDVRTKVLEYMARPRNYPMSQSIN